MPSQVSHLRRDLENLKRNLLFVGKLALTELSKAIDAYEKREVAIAQEVADSDKLLDQREVRVEEECLRIIALNQPVAQDLRYLISAIKINGLIMPVNPQVMDGESTRKIAYEMLTPAQIERFEKDLELNFSKPVPGVGNFRVNMFWQKSAVSAVIRFVTADIPSTTDLNLPPVLSSLVMEKRGLILVVGATGSGKSTTLASMLDFRNQMQAGHILTIEDPVEYVFTPKRSIINQREVGHDTLTFQEALRNAMRQAPDCILIGEIRDQETMRMALTYALSGHLCLATLHANNSYQAMNRVISFFPLEVRPMLLQDLSVSLKAIISFTSPTSPFSMASATLRELSSTSTAGARLPSTVLMRRCEMIAFNDTERSCSSIGRTSSGKKLITRFIAW